MPPYAAVRVAINDDGFGSDNSSSSKETKDYKKKNLRDRLSGSIDASIDFLAYNGVAKSSIAELRLAHTKSMYLPAMKRTQEYIECCVHNLQSPEEKQAAAYMTMQAWAALAEFTRLIHQRVYSEYNELLSQPKTPERRERIKQKLTYMNRVAEYSCGSQAGLLRAQAWENRLNAQ